MSPFFLVLLSLFAQNVQYSYDGAGRLTKVDYGNGRVINYSYDAAGNLTRRQMTESSAFTAISSASLLANRSLAPGMIASGFGSALAPALEVAGAGPLPLSLGGTRVEIIDALGVEHRAPLFFVSPTQINFLIPASVSRGVALIRAITAQGARIEGTIQIARAAPGLYTARANGVGIAAAFALRIDGDGTRTQSLIFDPATGSGVPINVSRPDSQVYLLLFGTGIRGYTSGVAARIGSESIPILGAVPQGEFEGLDQVNIGPLPASLAGQGEVDLVLTVAGQSANPVQVRIQ